MNVLWQLVTAYLIIGAVFWGVSCLMLPRADRPPVWIVPGWPLVFLAGFMV